MMQYLNWDLFYRGVRLFIFHCYLDQRLRSAVASSYNSSFGSSKNSKLIGTGSSGSGTNKMNTNTGKLGTDTLIARYTRPIPVLDCGCVKL